MEILGVQFGYEPSEQVRKLHIEDWDTVNFCYAKLRNYESHNGRGRP